MLTVLMGCAPKRTDPNQDITSGLDPYQSFNRSIFKFNTGFQRIILQPTVNVYTTVLPHPVRKGVNNFFANIGTLPAMANDLLQLNVGYFVTDSMRFVLNSTLGLGGLMDVATDAGIEAHPQSFGLTLARWGVVRSPYLVIPFLGPSTFRDALGMIPDAYASPINWVKPDSAMWGLWGLSVFNTSADALPQLKLIQAISLDPYVAERNAFLQNRAHIVNMIRQEKQPSNDSSGHGPRSETSTLTDVLPVHQENLGYTFN